MNASDRSAFLATVDPENSDFREQQLVYDDNLRALSASQVSYEMDDLALTPAPVPGDDATGRPDVTEHVLIKTSDTLPVGNPVGYTFVKRDGRWVLGAEDDDSFTYRGGSAESRPWGGDPIAVRVRDHIVVVTDKSQSQLIDLLAAVVARDIRDLADLLNQHAEMRLLVDATSQGDPVRVEALSDDEAAAITYPAFAMQDAEPTQIAGWRVKLNPDLAREHMLDPEILRHELTHVVLRDLNVCSLSVHDRSPSAWHER